MRISDWSSDVYSSDLDGETRSLARASVDVRGNLAHPRQQLTPMLAQSPLEQHQLEAVPCGMALRDRIPAAMLDGHAGFVAHRFEAYLDLGRLSGREARQTPAEGEVFAGRPAPHRADLPFLR